MTAPATALLATEYPNLLAGRRPALDEDVLFELHRLLHRAGVRELLDQWDAEDRARNDARRAAQGLDPVRGGRPRVLHPADVLIVTLALLIARDNPLLTTIADAFRHRLSPASRRLLDLPEHEPTSNCDRYMQVHRVFARLDDLINPAPRTAGRRRTVAESRALFAAIDPDGAARRNARAVELSNRLIELSIALLPGEVSAAWNGDIAIDATAIRVWGRRGNARGYSQGSAADTATVSPEPMAGWYQRDGDHGEPSATGRPAARPKLKFAYEIHTAVMTAPTGPDGTTGNDFPKLILAAILNAPGRVPGKIAASLLRNIHDRGHPAGNVITDRLYFPMSHPDTLQRAALALGYRSVFDYPDHMLGQQGQVHGMLLIDGNLFSPALPPQLRDISRDHRDGKIDADEYQRLLAARAPYLMHRKQRLDPQGRMRFACPATGPHPTLLCARRQARTTAPARAHRTMLPFVAPPRATNSTVCAQNTVTVDFADDTVAKLHQHLVYGSEEWRRHYQGPRAIVESTNQELKNSHYGRLDDPGLRRLRGYGKQVIVVAAMIAAVNIRTIRAFLERRADTTEPAPLTDQRRRRAPRRDFDLRTCMPSNSPPTWLPGHTSPAA